MADGVVVGARASLIRLRDWDVAVELGRRLEVPIVPGDAATGGRTTDAEDRGVCTNRPRVGAEGDDEADGVDDESESKESAAWAAGTGILVAMVGDVLRTSPADGRSN